MSTLQSTISSDSAAPPLVLLGPSENNKGEQSEKENKSIDGSLDKSSSRKFPSIEDITLRRHPALTLEMFGKAVYGTLPKELPWSQKTTTIWASSIILLLAFHHHGKHGGLDTESSNYMQQLCHWLQDTALDTLFWLGCGLLSTVGLGSGLQTGALFLFPHVCRVALSWCKEAQLDSSSSSLAGLLFSVAVPGFWSGSGSAVGELVPFVLARLVRQAGGDPFAILNTANPSMPTKLEKQMTSSTLSTSSSQESLLSLTSSTISDESAVPTASWTPQLMLANSRVAMEDQLSTNTFWKVFLLAVVPNGVFDLAGLVCGASTGVSMWDFFFATWTAKALVRTPAQTCGLALGVVAIVRPTSLTQKALSSDSTGARRILEKWGRAALAEFVGGSEFATENSQIDGESLSLSTISSVFFPLVKFSWALLTVGLFFVFIVGTIEQIAQHYARTRRGEPQAAKKKK